MWEKLQRSSFGRHVPLRFFLALSRVFDLGVFQRRELDWQQERERGIGRGTYTGRLAGSGETWVSLLKRGAYPLDFVANYLGGQAL